MLSCKKMLCFRFFFFAIVFACTLMSSRAIAQCNTPDTLSINYSCLSSDRVSFSAIASACITNLQWTFGDIASGNLNTSIGTTATHIFTTPGAYTVTLTATGQNGETLVQTQPINIINASFKFLTNLSCYSKVYVYDLEITGGGSHYSVEWELPSFPTPFFFTYDSPPPYRSELNDVYGLYKVTVSAANTCSSTASFYFSPPPPQLTHTTAITPANCSLSNGAVSIKPSGGTPPYTYSWNPNVSQSATASNLPKGNYYITVKDDNGCADNFSAAVGTKEAVIGHKEDIKQPVCTANGAIAITPSGGVAPYSYSWAPAVSNSSAAKGLAAGTYNIEVKDKNGCSEQFAIKLQQQSTVLDVQTDIAAPDCGTANGSIVLLPSRGTAPYTYLWGPPLVNNGVRADSLAAGTYKAAVTDANGCAGAVTTTLYEKPLIVSLGKDTSLCAGDAITLSPGTFDAYQWNDLSNQPALQVETPGTYSVTVTNRGGCTAKANIVVAPGCGDVVFPSAFTPNGDLKNDQFGPVGALFKIKNYSLQVYNRFGAAVFRSQNPYEQWNGKAGNMWMIAGTYVFIATFELDGEKRIVKGTVTLLL